MAMLASWLEGDHHHLILAPLVFEKVAATQMDFDPPLHVLQALLLSVVYATCRLTTEGMLVKALGLHGTLISACRYLGIFNGRHDSYELGDDGLNIWIAQEQLHR
jgi:hypothetical protein